MVETEARHCYLFVLAVARHLALRDHSNKLVVRRVSAAAVNRKPRRCLSELLRVDRFYPPSAETGASDIHLKHVTGHYRYRKRRCAPDAVLRRCQRDTLGDSLERHTGVPVYIQHDISAGRWQRRFWRFTRRARRYRVVIDHNVGAGVITDGHLLHAGSSSLVEVGMRVDHLW